MPDSHAPQYYEVDEMPMDELKSIVDEIGENGDNDDKPKQMNHRVDVDVCEVDDSAPHDGVDEMDELKNEIDEVDEIDENDDIPEQITPWPSVWSMDGHARFSCQHQLVSTAMGWDSSTVCTHTGIRLDQLGPE